MFIRFQAPFPNAKGHHTGVFGLANGLARGRRLSEEDHAAWRAGNDWFNNSYPDPSAADPSVYDPHVNPLAAAWFKASATHLLVRVEPYLKMLESHGVECVKLVSENPGRIIYEDDVQVVVIPHGRND